MNTIQIKTDGVCVYLVGKVASSRIARVLLCFIGLSLVTGIALTIFSKGDLQSGGTVLIVIGVLGTLLSKYLLWNAFGEEIISFSTKTIVSQYNYGIIQSAKKVMEHGGRLAFHFEVMREEDGIKEGLVHFQGYDKNNQPIPLFRTTVYMSEKECNILIEKIQIVFERDPVKMAPPIWN
jgi:hypothetical protein